MFTVKWRVFPGSEPGCFGTFQSLPDAIARAVEHFQYNVDIWVENDAGEQVVQYEHIEKGFEAATMHATGRNSN